MNNIEPVLEIHDELGESPVWCEDEHVLYWIDGSRGIIHRLQPDAALHETFSAGVPLGVIALRASGGLVMATRDGFALWKSRTQELCYLARPEEGKPFMTFNDGAVDCAGRFWAGSMNQDEEAPPGGTLYRLDPDGTVVAMFAPVGIPNGIGWSPDNTIMYFTDSRQCSIFAFDFDPAAGTIANQRVFATISDDSVMPDGLTIDHEGYIWSAHWGGGRVVRYAPDGHVERVVRVPALHTTSCAFGGTHLDDLYITSASGWLTAEQRAQYPLSGGLFRLKAGIQGREKFKFRG